VVTTAKHSKPMTKEGERPYEDRSVMKIVQTNSAANRSIVSSRNTKSLYIASNNLYDQQDDKKEALEYNNYDLPEEYLLAKLAFTKDHAMNYRE
jgi:hypothetical protein